MASEATPSTTAVKASDDNMIKIGNSDSIPDSLPLAPGAEVEPDNSSKLKTLFGILRRYDVPYRFGEDLLTGK